MLGNLGLAYRLLGQKVRAIEHYEQALVIFRDVGDRHDEAMKLKDVGLVYDDLGQTEKSIELVEAAVRILDLTGGMGATKAREQLASLRKDASKKWWQFWL